MATVRENLTYWDTVYDWSQEGEEWSRGFGGTQALWCACLRPRVARFLPAHTVLEIAPGFGRFTPFLGEECQRYIGVDLSPKCIDACQQRFSDKRWSFFVNDGKTLPMVGAGSVDFLFSFFSLIHADIATVQSYANEFARVLTPNGGGFVHHSNLAEHATYFAALNRLPRGLQRRLFEWGLVDLPQWRAPAMSIATFEQCCRKAGLTCITQETVNFGSRRTIDAFTTFVRTDHPKAPAHQVWRNPQFMLDAMKIRAKAEQGKISEGRVPATFYGPLETG